MFSPSALGGSICLRCQIRAVARRAPPLLAAPVRGRRRQFASDATRPRPEDVPPAVETREHGREVEQRPDEPRQPQPDEPSPAVIPEQTLSNPPRDGLGNTLDLPDRTVTDENNLHGIEKRNELVQSSRADFDLTDSVFTSEHKHGIQARTGAWKTNQVKDLTGGQAHRDPLSTTASALVDRTCHHCRKVFSNPARRDDHTRQGCASLKPPRNLECPTCGKDFGTSKLLHRHWAKSSCSKRAKPQKLAEKKGAQNVEDVLTRAAAEFSRSQATARRKSAAGADDWDLPPRNDVRLQAAPADHEPVKSMVENAVVDIQDGTQTGPEIQDEKTDTTAKIATIQEGAARGRDMGSGKRAETDSPVVLIRKIGKFEPTARGRKKEHRRGDMLLVEDASKLGIESLGKEAEVIVLRDGRHWARRAPPVAAGPEKTMDEGLKIEDWMEEEDVLSLDDVMENIHGLKPERQIVSAREYKSLFDTLFNGFTILQLEKYAAWHREQPILKTIKDEVFGDTNVTSEEPAIPADVTPKHRQYVWMTEEAHWTPSVDGAVEDAQYPLAGYILKSMPPKQRLVVQLMRECWGISIQELLNGNGHIDIRVRDLEFKLLTLGSQSWLRDLSRRFLKEGQQIEVRRSSNLIRITAPKSVAETCVNRLDNALQKTKTRTLDLDRIPVQHLDGATLEDLGRITNSSVHFGPKREAIHVTWIDVWDAEAQSTFENPADKVFRLLLTASPSARTWSNLTVYPDVEGNGKLMQDHNNKEKLSWTDRRSEWARLCLPLTPKQQRAAKAWPLTTDVLRFRLQPTEEDLALPYSTYQRKVDEFNATVSPLGLPKTEEEKSKEQVPAQEPETMDATSSGWRPFKVTTNAAFGHVLHLGGPKLTENIARPHISTTLSNWPRTFAPLIPHVAEMALPAWTPYDSVTKGRALTILMRFAPYSDNAESAIYTARAPPLELRLACDDLEVKGVHSLRAINRTSISDILLPAEHVDVRTTQQEYAELPPNNIDSTEGMEPLREFLEKSRFDLRKGKLKTPPRLHNLGLPRWLLAPPLDIVATEPTSRVDVKRKKAKAAARPPQNLPHTPQGNEIRNASYVFAGLEFRYAVETAYDGWKLVYTSIEGGAGGGRRAELSLEAVPGYDKDLRRAKDTINATFFLRSIYQLATGQPGHLVQKDGGEEKVRTSISWVR